MALPLQVDVIYGPVNSRRLGRSLGINLMPGPYKLYSFNCVYCHYGWTKVHTMDAQSHAQDLPALDYVVERVRLAARSALDFDYLTFSGNGEPTLYPQFAELVTEVARIRDRHRPEARIALLSNSTGLLRQEVRDSLAHIDLPVFKLDAGRERTFRLINRPAPGVDFQCMLDLLCGLNGICLQTLLVDGAPSNVGEDDLQVYFDQLARIRPKEVHLYSIDRPVPDECLVKVGPRRLQAIGRRAQDKTGVKMRAFWME